ncbi:MAG: ribosome-recycling factor, partial [Patescibacteria group bacterium]
MSQGISQVKQQMEEAVATLTEDLRTLRPGRASADLISSLPVAAYGGTMPLNQVASTSSNDQGQIIVQPWDKTVIGAVDTAIRNSQLGFSVVNEGELLRLSLPPLSQERRAEFAKLVTQKGEAARIRLRQIRSEAHQGATKQKTAGDMREDELNRFTKELNDLIDKQNTQIKDIVSAKEK